MRNEDMTDADVLRAAADILLNDPESLPQHWRDHLGATRAADRGVNVMSPVWDRAFPYDKAPPFTSSAEDQAFALLERADEIEGVS